MPLIVTRFAAHVPVRPAGNPVTVAPVAFVVVYLIGVSNVFLHNVGASVPVAELNMIVLFAKIVDGEINTELATTVHAFASFTVTVYVPATTVKVFPDWYAPPLRLYSYGAVPPEAVALNNVVAPEQGIVPADADAVNAVGWATTNETVAPVHVLASFTVTTYEPATTVKLFPDW